MKKSRDKCITWLLTIMILLVDPFSALANDTSNRMFTYNDSANLALMCDTELNSNSGVTGISAENYPFYYAVEMSDYKNSYYDDLEYMMNYTYTLKVYSDRMEIPNTLTFNDYYLPIGSNLQIFKGNDFYTVYPFNPVVTSTVTIQGINFIKSVNFGTAYGLTPNTSYWLYLGGTGSSTSQYSDDAYSNNVIRSGKIWTWSTSSGANMYGAFGRPAVSIDSGCGVINYPDRIVGLGYQHYNREYPSMYVRRTPSFIFYTPCDDPLITVSNVTTNTATIDWSSSNNNPSPTSWITGTTYSLYYQTLTGSDENNDSHYSAWTLIPINASANTALKNTTQAIFQQDNTYRLKVVAHHAYGQGDVTSNYAIFSTSIDPAVRAAREAATKAEAARVAAEEARTAAAASQTAAEAANTTAQEVSAKIDALDLKASNLQSLINNLSANSQLNFNKMVGKNNSTCTENGLFTVRLIASGAESYRVYDDSVDSGWVPTNEITVTLTQGIHELIGQAKNAAGAVVEDVLTVFSL